ncbi:MAG: TRAP transporter small permease [Betaproteobacteria bacterium]
MLLTRICAPLAKYLLMVAVVGLMAIVACVSFQVFGRYIMNDTPTWAEALALVLVIWVTMFGAAVGVRDAGHIGMESLLVLVPERIRLKLEIVIHFLVGIFGALMAYNGALLAESVMGYKIPTLGIPEGLNHVPVAIAGALILLFSIEHIVALLHGTEVEPSWH